MIKSTCMLHNNNTCSKISAIKRAKGDDGIRIVYAYDWNTPTHNYMLIREQIKDVINEFTEKYIAKVSFTRLGGKDASIYCDICRQIQSADIAIFNLSTNNLNVVFELGLAIGTGKFIFLLRSKHYKKTSRSLSDLNGILEYRYSSRSGQVKFDANFKKSLLNKLNVIAKKISLKVRPNRLKKD